MAKLTKVDAFIAMLAEMTDEEKIQARALLGVVQVTQGVGSKSRITTKFVRTDKAYEGKLNRQMSALINSLPTDREVGVEEWGELAVANGLQTQQPPVRIVNYYKRNLVEMGYAQSK